MGERNDLRSQRGIGGASALVEGGRLVGSNWRTIEMPTRVITLRVTEKEQEILDWLLVSGGFPSVSEVIRTAVLRTALHLGMNPGDAAQSVDARLPHRPRQFKRKKPGT